MKNKRKFSLYLALAALLLASLACKAVQGSSPTSVPEDSSSSGQTNPVVPSLPPVATSEAPAQTGGAYNGDWTGKNTVDDKEILFKVEDNQVTSIALNYTGEASGCTYHGAVSASVDPVTITSDEFSIDYTNNNDTLTFSGTFTSEGEASGKLLIKSSSSGICGEFEKEIAWTASKGSTADTELAATEDTSSTASDVDTQALVNQFFDAVNAGDLETAVTMLDENVLFSIGSDTQFNPDSVMAYFQSTHGVTYKISNVQAFGDIVQFKAEASDGKVYTQGQVFVSDGKITMLSLMP